MTDQSLIITERNQDLESWGDRRDLREMTERIKTMLPNGAILEPHEALALAQASHLTKLNPFEGEIYFLKNPKTGESKGVYTGIKGRRRKAREQLYRQVGKGANFWIEYEFATAEWKAANNYDPQATVCIATLRDTGTINEYVRIVTALVAARMSAADIKAIAGDRPFVTGIGFVKPGEFLIRPLREVAKKRAERSALAQRFDIGLEIKSDDATDDNSDDSVADLDTAGPDWERITDATYTPVTLEQGKKALGRDNGDLTSQPDPIPHFEPLPSDVIPQPESKPVPATNGNPKIASIKFNHQTVDEWKAASMSFIVANPNWAMKNGLPDMGHIQASAGHCGYATIDGDNRDEVFSMIKAAHESKQADAA